METRSIELNKLQFNACNPNEMTDSMFEHLTETIDDMGFLQNILVWERKDDQLVVIDGEHRVKAERERNASQIEAKLLNDNDILEIGKKLEAKGKIRLDNDSSRETLLESIAKTLTVLMNDIRGELNPVKYAELLESLKPVFDTEHITKILQVSEKELDSYKQLLKMDENELKKAIKIIKEKQDINEINLILNDEQFKIINQALEHLGSAKPEEGIVEICKLYLESKGEEIRK